MLFLISLAAVLFAILSTIARAGVHSANGFRNFSQSGSAVAKMNSVMSDFCTIVVLPGIYVAVFWNENMDDFAFLFSGSQRYFWAAWIIIYTAGYFFAVNSNKLYKPPVEVLFNLLAGVGIVLNLVIAWPMFFEEGAVWLILIGNLPIVFLLLLVFTRRQALLLDQTPEILDERRYANPDILDYLPEPGTSVTYDFSGNTGKMLRQPLPMKILLFILSGAIILALSAAIIFLFGIEIYVGW